MKAAAEVEGTKTNPAKSAISRDDEDHDTSCAADSYARIFIEIFPEEILRPRLVLIHRPSMYVQSASLPKLVLGSKLSLSNVVHR